ncbi:MAG: TGS domain-containing protein, partial [Bacteroidota bacterium]|nr:TGS domain-containing protein [Bacteroidota bacterium]
MKIKVTLPDGSVREFEQGVSAMDVARNISEGLARNVLSCKVGPPPSSPGGGGMVVMDANRALPGDCSLQLLTWNDQEGKSTMWHSSAHVMAEALEELYPGVKFGIGPPIENGFYYDIDLGDRTIGEGEFKAIETRMKELAGKKNTFDRREVPKAEAVAFFTEKGDEYKLELLEGLKDGEITFYQQGNFVDLCRGPHIPDTSFIKAMKIMSVAGAYWRGDEKRKQLTRLYGITFPKQKDLEEYLV